MCKKKGKKRGGKDNKVNNKNYFVYILETQFCSQIPCTNQPNLYGCVYNSHFLPLCSSYVALLLLLPYLSYTGHVYTQANLAVWDASQTKSSASSWGASH